MAKDGGGEGKKRKMKREIEDKKNTKSVEDIQIKLNSPENISNNVTVGESEESMAYYYISQSLPKTEKVSKQEEKQQKKINRKIINKERKECRKLQKTIRKDNQNTVKNQ